MSVLLLWVVSPADVSGNLGFSDSIRGGGKFSDGSRSLNGGGTGSSWKAQGRKPKRISCSLNTDFKYGCLGFEPENGRSFPLFSSLVANPAGEIGLTSEQKVYDVVLKQAALVKDKRRSNRAMDVKPEVVVPGTIHLLNEAYDRCREVCAEYAKTFYLGWASYPFLIWIFCPEMRVMDVEWDENGIKTEIEFSRSKENFSLFQYTGLSFRISHITFLIPDVISYFSIYKDPLLLTLLIPFQFSSTIQNNLLELFFYMLSKIGMVLVFRDNANDTRKAKSDLGYIW